MGAMAGRNPNARGRDMVISMAVLIIPLALITWFFTVDPEPVVEPVDPGPTLAVAAEESPYPVLSPANLPADWTPTRVAWAADGERWITGEPAVGNSWQLGYLAPNEIYVAVQQRDRATQGFLRDVTREGVPEGSTVGIDGRDWERWVSADDRTRALVWRDGEMVAVVAGDTDFAQLEAFTGTLAAT